MLKSVTSEADERFLNTYRKTLAEVVRLKARDRWKPLAILISISVCAICCVAWLWRR
jgi:hypothetical protein